MPEAATIDVKPIGLAAVPVTEPAPSPAAAFDMTAWYEEHVAQLHQALYLAVKGLTAPGVAQDAALLKRLGDAHAELQQHAGLAASAAVPYVLAKDGKRFIPYSSLAEARAKVKVLTTELALARAEIAARSASLQPKPDVATGEIAT